MKKSSTKSKSKSKSRLRGQKLTIPNIINKSMVEDIKRYDMPINAESMHKCASFMFRCHQEAQDNLASDASFYLEELMRIISGLYADLIQEGNFRLAGSFPSIRKRLAIIKRLDKAYAKYGARVRTTPRTRSWYNRFVEYLYRGYLWDGDIPQPICPWNGKENLPPIEDVDAWMQLIRKFLKDSYDEPYDIPIFRPMLNNQKAVYAQTSERTVPLRDDKECYQWDQVFAKIRNAWKQMAKDKKMSRKAKIK